MDVYSSSSKYDKESWIYGYAVIIAPTHFPCLSFFGFSVHLSPFSSTNSEEAKSTTWLHPVTGEAVITGHRKTPGKHPRGLFLQSMPTYARTRARSTWEMFSTRQGGKRGDHVSERETGGRFCSRATASLLRSSGGPLRTAHPPPDLGTLRHTF